MPEFRYAAIAADGGERSGTMRAATSEAARATLARRQLFVTRLEAAPAAGPSGRRLPARQLTLFTRQLATLASVTPLEEALRTIVRQTEVERARAVISRVHGGVLEGRRLSDAMAAEPASFPPLFRAMVAAGEAAGTLPEILERLAALLERQAQVRSKVIQAVAYPAALAVVASLVVIALMIFVVPRVVAQFEDIGQTLPLLTRIVIGISAFLSGWWWLLALLVAGFGALLARALADEAFRLRLDRRLLALPFVGRLLRDLNAARLSRTLATMVASRLPVVEGLALTVPTIGNRVLRRAAGDMVVDIREGGSLSAALRRAGVFPPLLITMAAGGESAGRLDLMLERAADYLEGEFDSVVATSLSLLEPAVIVIMGGIVAAIVLSILLPILQLDSLAAA